MAAKKNNGILQFVGLVIVVVAVSGGMGYFLADSGRQAPVAPPVPAAPATADTTPSAAAKPTDPNAIIAQGNDYTAPGAPRISIQEVKPPRLTDTSHAKRPEATQPDSEASQVAAPDASTDTTTTTTASPTDAANSSSTDNVTSPVSGDTAADGTTTPDTDYESVGNNSPDTTAAAPPPPDDGTATPNSAAPYRVQVGQFAYAKNAKVLADALKTRGYTATTVIDKVGDKTVYRVQAGAFRSQKSADKSSQDLQKDGFPAFTKQAQ